MSLMYVAEGTKSSVPGQRANGLCPKPAPRTRSAQRVRIAEAPRVDDVLIDRLTTGDPDAFREIVDGWSPVMFRVARRHVSTDASAEEIVQETWLQIVRGLEGFEGRSSLRTWVFTILSNLAKVRGVREARSVPWSSIAPDNDDPASSHDLGGAGEVSDSGPRLLGAGSNPEDHVPASWAIARETRQMVSAAIRELPRRQQEVVRLRDIEGHSAEDVCAHLGISAGNQRVLLHRARAGLRSSLVAYYRQV